MPGRSVVHRGTSASLARFAGREPAAPPPSSPRTRGSRAAVMSGSPSPKPSSIVRRRMPWGLGGVGHGWPTARLKDRMSSGGRPNPHGSRLPREGSGGGARLWRGTSMDPRVRGDDHTHTWIPACAGMTVLSGDDGSCHATKARALRNTRIHGESSPHSAGAQLKLAVRSVRSGCGIRIVLRPSAEVTPAIASVEPFGFAG